MDNNLKKLEFNKILEILKSYCITDIGKTLALTLLPSNNVQKVKNILKETEEAVNLTYRNSYPNFYEFEDITISIKDLEAGASLSIHSILNLNKLFKMAYEFKNYFYTDFIDSDEFSVLNQFFDSLYSNKTILDEIQKSIIDDYTIADDASDNLKNIRRKERSLEQNIHDKLSSMLHSPKFSKYLQDAIITRRNDRYVIPVKEEYRSQVKGFVHDVSNAGSTLFIEPVSIFEMNNEINQLKAQEEIEIEKILQKLSSLFMPYTEELKQDSKVIGKLDFIFAKARYSRDINGITPKINDNKEINLINARHPLIDPDKVVPISLSLGNSFSTLLITGPNTGGKTVTIKTVGLLCSMACSGLNIPAKENSSIYVFDKIFADIGDDQSITNSLSTFSSHMVNIVSIINNASNNSLVLVDELGSGTDPIEGANLAISILEYLYNIGSLTIATTHYPELKNYALTTKGFENASVEFDVNTLKPTYKLLVGIPGKSNAFAISQNLGLPANIIEKAKSMMTTQQINIEDLLKNIYDQKSKIEQEKVDIDTKLENISNLEKSLTHDNEKLKAEELNIINNAKIKARNILLDAKEEANDIIKEMTSISKSSNNSKNADLLRSKLNKDIKNINITKVDKNFSENSLDISEAVPKTEVFIKSLGKNGTIISYPSKSNEVQVQVGILKMNIAISDLEKISKPSSNSKPLQSTYSNITKTRNISSEINVIGMNVEDANFVIDQFLDDASMAKLKTIRIVHGKGTGKLREGIHRFLKKNTHVKSFRIGTYGEGEMGVTVVELK